MEFTGKPKTAEEYVKMVDQALIEIDEFRSCLEFEVEEEGGQGQFLDPLEEAVRRLRNSMADGSYYFENKDLPFMVIVNRFKNRLPFSRLLVMINRTHREGLDIGDA